MTDRTAVREAVEDAVEPIANDVAALRVIVERAVAALVAALEEVVKVGVLDVERELALEVTKAQAELEAAVRKTVEVLGDGTEATAALKPALEKLVQARVALREAENTRDQRRGQSGRINGKAGA